MDIGSYFLDNKGTGREAGYSVPSSAEVKKGGTIPPLPHTYSWRDI